MSLDRLVLILFCCLLAAGLCFWLTGLVLAAIHAPLAWLALIPAAIAGYVVYRVIAERLGNPEEDHYDRMEH